jgi:hypothetical protein
LCVGFDHGFAAAQAGVVEQGIVRPEGLADFGQFQDRRGRAVELA